MQVRGWWLALAMMMQAGPLAAAEPPHFADAPLRAVHFVDEHEGWAAGDDGVILHTINGGQTWERQPTGVRASLRSIAFLDAFTGFVVGRESLPHGTGSVGVILFTDDGGVKWQRISLNEMPGFHQIQFVDKKTAFLVGDATDHFPSGIFISEDSGITWKPVPGPRSPGWFSGHFTSERHGTVVGPWGCIGHVFKGELQREIKADDLKGATLRGVRRLENHKIVVGEGGLILENSAAAAGKGGPPRFVPVDLGYSPALQKCVDFHAVHFVGDQGWVVGRPGSQVLHTWDGGKSWQAQNTGQPLPLHAVYFLDARRGWAVGEMGTIVATADGGKTWKVQRRGGRRAAILCVHAKGEFLPAATLAALGMDQGYLCAAIQVSRADPRSAAAGFAMESPRFAEAVRRAGGCGGELLRFVWPQHLHRAAASDLVKFWGQSADEARGMEELQRQMVLAIRIWQPDVILTDNPDPVSATGQGGAVVALALSGAFELAGKADAYPEQITKLGLEPWNPSKLYGRWEKATGAQVTMDLSKPQDSLKASPRRFVADSLGLLFDEPVDPPAVAHFRLLASHIDVGLSHQHLLQGIELGHGGHARRAMVDRELTSEARALLERRENQYRDLVEIARTALGDARHARGMLASVEKALAGLGEEPGGEAAFAIGNLYARAGQWLMAKEVFVMMVDRYPTHRLAPEACRWLMRYGSSSEARRRDQLDQFWSIGHYEFEVARNLDKTSVGPIRVRETSKPKRDLTRTLYRRSDELREWHKCSLALAEHLQLYGPLFADDPEFQFPLQASRRALGEIDAAQLWYSQFRLKQSAGPWFEVASAELWLHKRQGPPPRPIVYCVAAVKPPYLDGKFDDECWKEARGVLFKDAVGSTAEEYATECWLAYDNNFLYLALRCKHPPGNQAAVVKPRRRDEDLGKFDRVCLMLDLDRDYATYFRFEVDQRGCVAEDCWGDKSWNPKWYVAVDSDETRWQIEAAIPLYELTGDKVGPQSIWACNVVRTIPKQGVQAFSLPADVLPRPEGMGLLTFLRSTPGGAAPANPTPMEPAKD